MTDRLKLAVMNLTADGAAGTTVVDGFTVGYDGLKAGSVMAPVGTGALLVGVETIGQLRTLSFASTGAPASLGGKFKWNALTAPYAFEGNAAIAGGASGPWLLEYTRNGSVAMLQFARLAADGQPLGSAVSIGSTPGSPPDLHVVSTAEGALGVWQRNLSSASGSTVLETAFIDGAGRVATACQP